MMHPVTREELERLVKGDFIDRAGIKNKILARPDPLEVLEAYTYHRYIKNQICEKGLDEYWEIRTIITELHENPDAVIARGKKEGWYP